MKRVLLSFVAAILVVAGTSTQTVFAGGSGDFYNASQCGFSSLGLVAKLTNYDIATGQRYHHSMNQSGGYWINYLEYNSSVWPFNSKYSGTKADGYQDFSTRSTKYSVTFHWVNSNQNPKVCTIYF